MSASRRSPGPQPLPIGGASVSNAEVELGGVVSGSPLPSSPSRGSFLTNLGFGRMRAWNAAAPTSPPATAGNSGNPVANYHLPSAAESPPSQPQTQTRRGRPAVDPNSPFASLRSRPSASTPTPNVPDTAASSGPTGPNQNIRLVPHLESSRSLVFDPVERNVPANGYVLKVGRFNEKMSNSEGVVRSAAGGGGDTTSQKIAFRSKVVSRCHAEIWVEDNGQFFIKDTSSSSGTFLNHIRLSPPGVHSKPFPLKDSDIIQLGVDFQGGHEEIYRCVKMKIELGKGREWQRAKNEFNTNAMQQLQALSETAFAAGQTTAGGTVQPHKRVNITDCCICLFSVSILQSLFIAPCSHVFHYKCIRPLLTQNHPGFSCPLCRTFADLDADVERDDWGSVVSRRASTGFERAPTTLAALNAQTPTALSPISAPLPVSVSSGVTADAQRVDQASSEVRTAGPTTSPLEISSLQSSTDELSQRSEFGFPEHDCSPEAAVVDDPFESNMEQDNVLFGTGASSVPSRTISPRSHSEGMLSPLGRLSIDSPTNGNMDSATPRNETFLSQLADSPHPPAALHDNDITQVGEAFEASVLDDTIRPAR